MSLIQESYLRLFPNKEFSYSTEIEYNRRLGDFNANISLHKNKIKVNMNLQWKDIDDEIKIGLIQHLLCRILKKKQQTQNINLYNNFIKNVHMLTPKTISDPILELSFHRLNEKFFFKQLEKPNLKWGKEAIRKLAHYNFHNDTVVMSSIFKDGPQEVLDYVMYHELLHKHFKFEHNNGRSSFHSKEFREAEKQYPNYQLMERKIQNIIRTKKVPKQRRRKGLFRFF